MSGVADRWRPWLGAAVAAALLVAGCGGSPEGVDGRLVDDWAAMPEPVMVVPEAGVCHDVGYSDTVRGGASYDPVPCTETHDLETVHVGTFEGDVADRGSSPNPGTGQWRGAYRECDERAADYLGADFRHGRLWLGVAVPTDNAWRGGARWFRCEVVRLSQFDIPTYSTTSLRDAFDEDPELGLGCFTGRTAEVEGSDFFSIEEMDGAPCDEPHRAEFVGVWDAGADASFPRTDNARARITAGCLERIAAYVDAPVADVLFRSGVVWWGISEQDWDNGDRGFRCFLWMDGDRLTDSLAGAGLEGLPGP